MTHTAEENRIPWEAGQLLPRLKAQSKHGLQVGALQPIETAIEYIESGGMRFVVRVLANLSRKEKARKQQGKTSPANPFLPYEKDLYVTDISETHLCLLNKFNVVDHHFLIVTREYEPQETWLTLADFEALVCCLAEVDGLAFFNGGMVAGASQPHKHLQVIPYLEELGAEELGAELVAFPIEQIMPFVKRSGGKQAGGMVRSPKLPFRHAILPLNLLPKASITPQTLFTHYHTLLEAVGITSTSNWKGHQTAAYNFLCTRQWMMIVPRAQEKYAGISVNSLGFAGSLLVKNQSKLEQLKKIGPMNLLQQVGYNLE
ncbi:MAG: DUF4922 domain-containing protein [Phormidesmis sp.]